MNNVKFHINAIKRMLRDAAVVIGFAAVAIALSYVIFTWPLTVLGIAAAGCIVAWYNQAYHRAKHYSELQQKERS